jgi:hypothetical protein
MLSEERLTRLTLDASMPYEIEDMMIGMSSELFLSNFDIAK